MLHLDHDMDAVFFGPDFAARFRRQRGPGDVKDVVGILGIADKEALEGRVVASARTLLMPGCSDVKADDVLTSLEDISALGVCAGTAFKVIDVPRRINDGAELEALLGSVAA